MASTIPRYRYDIYVDGKKIGILWESKKTQKELQRIRDLKGVHIKTTEVAN